MQLQQPPPPPHFIMINNLSPKSDCVCVACFSLPPEEKPVNWVFFILVQLPTVVFFATNARCILQCDTLGVLSNPFLCDGSDAEKKNDEITLGCAKEEEKIT